MKKTIVFGENGFVTRDAAAEAWRKEMARYDVLDNDVIVELVVLAQNGDNKARTKVVNHNLRLVWSIASRYNGLDCFMDIIQNGNIGLIKAVDTFKAEKGVAFTTWALQNIIKYINIGLFNESQTIRVRADLYGIANVATESMDAPLGGADGEDGDKTLGETIASATSADNFSEVEHKRAQIEMLMKGLKDTEKAVVCGLFGFGCVEETENTLAMKFGLTKERIRQIKVEALTKMAKMAK